MPRRPGQGGLPVIQRRPISEWINRVNSAREELSKLRALLPPDRAIQLEAHLDSEFVRSNLALDGIRVEPAELALALSKPAPEATHSTNTGRLLSESVQALRLIQKLANAEAKEANLTFELLHQLHTANTTGEGATSGDRPQASLPHNAASLEALALWTAADSFKELHAIEQSAIVLLRLLEINPFQKATGRLARLAASLFTIRAGLAPIIVPAGLSSRYLAAVEEGTRMNTQPMVELLAECLDNALRELIGLAGGA